MTKLEVIKKIDKILLADGRRIGPLDGIRAIAITLVVFRHCFDRPLANAQLGPFLSQILGFGWVGVSLFFSLSGFLIGGMIFEKLRQSRFSFKEFYINRALRILPIAYAMFIYTSRRLIGFNYDTLINFTFLTNVFKSHHFQGHFWSLCVEEQFYLIFPSAFAFLFIFFHKKPRPLVYALISLVALQWALRAILVNTSKHVLSNAYFGSPCQIDFLLFGVIGAVLYYDQSDGLNSLKQGLRKISKIFLLCTPLVFIGLAYLLSPMNGVAQLDAPLSFALGYPLIALSCFLTIFGVVEFPDHRISKFLSAPLFRWIAAISYSMYIMQFQVIDRVNLKFSNVVKAYPDHSYLIAAMTIMTAYFLIACLSTSTFLLIEKPFQMLKKRLSYKGLSSERQ